MTDGIHTWFAATVILWAVDAAFGYLFIATAMFFLALFEDAYRMRHMGGDDE